MEHANYVPLVMSTTGGLAKQATNLYKRLASLRGATLQYYYWLILPIRYPVHTWCTFLKGACCETFTSGPGDGFRPAYSRTNYFVFSLISTSCISLFTLLKFSILPCMKILSLGGSMSLNHPDLLYTTLHTHIHSLSHASRESEVCERLRHMSLGWFRTSSQCRI